MAKFKLLYEKDAKTGPKNYYPILHLPHSSSNVPSTSRIIPKVVQKVLASPTIQDLNHFTRRFSLITLQ